MRMNSFRHTTVYGDWTAAAYARRRHLSRWSYNDVCRKAHPPLPAPQARRCDGGNAPPHHRGRRGAARDGRAGAHDDDRGGRARGRAAPDGLPPLRRRGGAAGGLLGALRGTAPLADAGRWRAIADPAERLRIGLDELYAWYETTEAMWTNVLRDETLVAALGPTLEPFRAYLDDAALALAAGWGARGGRRTISSPRPAMPSTSTRGAHSRATAASAARASSSSCPRW